MDLQALLDKAAEASTEKQRIAAVKTVIDEAGLDRAQLDELAADVVAKYQALESSEDGTDDTGLLGRHHSG